MSVHAASTPPTLADQICEAVNETLRSHLPPVRENDTATPSGLLHISKRLSQISALLAVTGAQRLWSEPINQLHEHNLPYELELLSGFLHQELTLASAIRSIYQEAQTITRQNWQTVLAGIMGQIETLLQKYSPHTGCIASLPDIIELRQQIEKMVKRHLNLA